MESSNASPEFQDSSQANNFKFPDIADFLALPTAVESGRSVPATISFLEFPSNIRKRVYTQLFYQREPLIYGLLDQFTLVNKTENQLLLAGIRLLRTCTQVYDEAIQVLYGCNTICLQPKNVSQLLLFFSPVGRNGLSRISSLVLDLQYQYESPGYDIEEIWPTLLSDPEDDSVAYLPRYHENHERISVPGHHFTKFLFGWKGVPHRREWFCDVSRIFGYLPNFEALARLGIGFSEWRYFAISDDCMRNDRSLLNKVLSSTQISELKIHGIENLVALESANLSTDLSSFIAELNFDGPSRLDDIKTGRPNLRTYPNWQLVHSDRYRVALKYQSEGACEEDRISRLPAEIRAQIFKFSLLDWSRGFYACVEDTDLIGIEEVFHPIIEICILKPRYVNRDEGNQNRTRSGHFDGFRSLLSVSSLFHRETASVLYSNLYFSNWHNDKMNSGVSIQVANVRDMAFFLNSIGALNRRYIRFLRVGLDAQIPFFYPGRSLFINDLPNVIIGTRRPTVVNLQASDLYWLFYLLPDIEVLDTLHLEIPSLTPRRKNMDKYLKPLSQLKTKVRCLRMMAYSVDLNDAEYMARVFGAETVELSAFGIDTDEARLKVKTAGWNQKSWDLIQKRLTRHNVSPAIADKLARRNV